MTISKSREEPALYLCCLAEEEHGRKVGGSCLMITYTSVVPQVNPDETSSLSVVQAHITISWALRIRGITLSPSLLPDLEGDETVK